MKQKLKDKFPYCSVIKQLNLLPMWIQLTILMAVVMTVPITIVSINMFSQNRSAIITSEVTNSRTILDLEKQNIEQYMKDLVNFSIQPCYDSQMTQLLSQKTPLTPSQKSYLKDEIRAYFYSRTDLSFYHLYLLNQGISVYRSNNVLRFEPFSVDNFKSLRLYQECSEGRYYQSVLPSENEDSVMVYSHAIIKIKNQEPVAIVSMGLDQSMITPLLKNHTAEGEFICIVNDKNDLLYSGNPSFINTTTPELLDSLRNITQSNQNNISIHGNDFLLISSHSSVYGFSIYCLKPYKIINEQMGNAGLTSLFWAISLWFLSLLLIVLITRLATQPLTTLAHRLKSVGKGDFTTTVDIDGSEEIRHLSTNFNYMVEHIDQLIKTNYISQLNEKTARITALEAQINPHFLYNTLQAIATEALLNDQPQIYNMITSLASNLRYSIKAGDFVKLKDEFNYADNYIKLQQMRLGDRLSVQSDIHSDTRNLMIPKISIQVLVENSVIHGMGDNTEQLHIDIVSIIKNDNLVISVTDNGCGFSPDQKARLLHDFSTSYKNNHSQGIGLLNLYSRLQLLYAVPCELQIESIPNKKTTISIIIPLTEATRNDI